MAKALDAAAALRRALLILHAPLDRTVGVENAALLFAAAKHPKSFVSLDGADHLLSNRADALYAADVIAAWASRYLETPAAEAANAPEAQAPAPSEASAPFPVVVEESGPHLRASVRAGRHTFNAGEPASLGGDDSGPSPYQILAAALGACSTMTVRLYAERKGVPLQGVRAAVAHERIETDSGPRDRFTRVMGFDGPLSPEQRDKLLEIAGKCPVHRTLERGSEVLTHAEPDMH
jgi:putative redox protein